MDEDLTGLPLADALNAHSEPHGCTFLPFPLETYRGAPDEKLPQIATELGATALLSANFSDVAAKEIYYRAFLEAGVSVVSLRVRSSDTGDNEYMANTLTKHMQKIARTLKTAEKSIVISVNKSSARPRSLRELLDDHFS